MIVWWYSWRRKHTKTQTQKLNLTCHAPPAKKKLATDKKIPDLLSTKENFPPSSHIYILSGGSSSNKRLHHHLNWNFVRKKPKRSDLAGFTSYTLGVAPSQ